MCYIDAKMCYVDAKKCYFDAKSCYFDAKLGIKKAVRVVVVFTHAV